MFFDRVSAKLTQITASKEYDKDITLSEAKAFCEIYFQNILFVYIASRHHKVNKLPQLICFEALNKTLLDSKIKNAEFSVKVVSTLPIFRQKQILPPKFFTELFLPEKENKKTDTANSPNTKYVLSFIWLCYSYLSEDTLYVLAEPLITTGSAELDFAKQQINDFLSQNYKLINKDTLSQEKITSHIECLFKTIIAKIMGQLISPLPVEVINRIYQRVSEILSEKVKVKLEGKPKTYTELKHITYDLINSISNEVLRTMPEYLVTNVLNQLSNYIKDFDIKTTLLFGINILIQERKGLLSTLDMGEEFKMYLLKKAQSSEELNFAFLDFLQFLFNLESDFYSQANYDEKAIFKIETKDNSKPNNAQLVKLVGLANLVFSFYQENAESIKAQPRNSKENKNSSSSKFFTKDNLPSRKERKEASESNENNYEVFIKKYNNQKDQLKDDSDWQSFEDLWAQHRNESFAQKTALLFEHYERQSIITRFIIFCLTPITCCLPFFTFRSHSELAKKIADDIRQTENSFLTDKGQSDQILNNILNKQDRSKFRKNGRMDKMMQFICMQIESLQKAESKLDSSPAAGRSSVYDLAIIH